MEKVLKTDTESGISSTGSSIKKEVNFDLSLITPATEMGPETPDDTILKPKDVIYEAESPDEAALVYTAKGYGVTLMKRDTQSVMGFSLMFNNTDKCL